MGDLEVLLNGEGKEYGLNWDEDEEDVNWLFSNIGDAWGVMVE